METPIPNGVRTNHDRDSWMNGVNGGSVKREMSPDKGKGAVAGMANGGDGSAMDVDSGPQGGPVGALPAGHYSSIEDLPDEMQHIVVDILPLSRLVSRLAQFTHGKLQEHIMSLASKPVPQAVANGNANYLPTGAEDTSPESLEKKLSLLKFIQDQHSKWVKALVISEWSKKADKVSKLIDIRAHLAMKVEEINQVFFDLVNTKRDLHWAKVPSPDLKTALEILSTGEVSWMPEFGYLKPPPVTPEETETWIDNINTMLSVRLSLDEYEKTPYAFRNYTIASGRVTFRVEGEFEVDLTIGDEDFEKQFWFIDFRFLFTPAPEELSETLRMALEAKVNEVLGIDGLAGCYKYLHEFILTQKITEFWRQAVELSRARWIDTLNVERLNRAMAIQYWVNRPHSQGSKSWIILGVNSGNGPGGLADPKSPSHLALRWFRDNKEVKDFDIPLDANAISAEDLVTSAIARHVEYLLGSIYNKLLSKPRFAQRHARLSLDISQENPSDSSLTVQLFDTENATVRVDGMTGSFSLLPISPNIQEGQKRLNSSPNPAEDGPVTLEWIRVLYTIKDLTSRTRSIGWTIVRSPITPDELKNMVHSATQSREAFQPAWLRKVGWAPQWFVIMTMSLSGDQWWLVELSAQPKPGPQGGARVKTFTKIPMASAQLSLTDHFFENLTVYVSGMISQITDLRELHSKKMAYNSKVSDAYRSRLPAEIRLPTIFVRLSDMLRPRSGETRTISASWAKDFVPIHFLGVQSSSGDQDSMLASGASQPRRDSRLKVIAEARLTVTNRSKFQLLKGNVDHDVAFDPRIGQFSLKLRADMGTPLVSLLAARIRSLERLVDFVEAIRRAGKGVAPVSATLREVVFTYGNSSDSNDPSPTAAPLPGPSRQPPRAWRVKLDISKESGVDISMEKGNPHLRVLDYLKSEADSSAFENLPAWLLWSLPLFRGIEKIEELWTSTAVKNEGVFQAIHKRPSWANLRFTLSPRRVLNLDIRYQDRRGRMVWHVTRSEPTGPANEANPGTPRRSDEFDRVLQKVWHAQANGIKGLGTSAAADPEKGIEKLLSMIDAAVRSLVGTPPGPGLPLAAAAQELPGPAGGPSMQQQAQPPPSQHPPQSAAAARYAASLAQQRQQQFQQLQQQQQQHNGQNQVHQRGGAGAPLGSNSKAPLVVLD
ncbi:mediator complex subunit MED14-domain-containing protein [Immersiella caudata]|uniref:Mediator of RNA polymerase II transcription subunit 14 n=1 Tax=Immersiella caudata TaxID=314043 RepID=A0AA40CBC0_9PEZI|nr:mediator complex subunit MED14-domain-containing protein [Immersiella caudata]